MKAVLFDFNGTLFDDTRFHHDAWISYMSRRFGAVLTEEELSARFLGFNNDEILNGWFGGKLSRVEVLRYAEEKEAEYRRTVTSDPRNMQLMDGAPELLDYLTERQIPFALATASMLPNVEFYLNELGLKRWFTMDRVVYDEGKLPGKPDPAFYLEAARRIGVAPEDCVVAEDTVSGIRAATAAHAGRIVVLDRSVSREKLAQFPGVHAVVHDYYGFERFLQE